MSKNISNQYPVVIIIASLIIIIAGIMNAVTMVNAFLMSLFLSIICAQPIRWLKSKKVPQALSIFIVIFGITIIFVAFSDIIVRSLSSFSQKSPVYEQNLKEMEMAVFDFFKVKGIDISGIKDSNIFDVTKVLSFTTEFLSQIGSFMGNAFTIFFLMLFLLFEWDGFSLKMKVILKDSIKSFDYISRIEGNIRHYLSIKTLTSLLTGGLIWICLEILGLDYAIIWALVAFLLNYIPNIGSIIAAVPTVIFSLIQLGFSGAIWTSIIFVGVNMVVGNIIEPKVMGKGLGLSTYVVFISLLIWGFVLGTVGMFLSVPLTMAIKIALEQNKKTAWIAILLGTEEEAEIMSNSEN